MINLEPEHDVLEIIGDMIVVARTSQRMTQTDLAQKAGISDDTLVRLEKGRSVTTACLAVVLEALGMVRVFQKLSAAYQLLVLSQKIDDGIRKKAEGENDI